jgi:uncharacterized phage protein (TIGR01671 family)
MIPKYRAWHKTWEEMGKVKRIRFDDDGNMTNVLFKGETLGTDLKIDEIELMQSTGLHDKNGQEIFEGDIVKRDGIKRLEVVRFGEWIDVDSLGYKEQYIGFYFESEHEGQEWLCSIEPQFHNIYKIIGNVYQNPELLEADHDRD